MKELAEIERSGIYSNFGPVNQKLEQALIETIFGDGHCIAVCNATSGLMVAIRQVIGENRPHNKRYALMPSFTFAATAHAALWNGLTPLLCDIDPESWLPSAEAEEDLIRQYRDQIAVIIPYATFGNNLDLARYDDLSLRYGIPVVIDAAASLGSIDAKGQAFGSGFQWPIVFSMHATKPFSAGEGGIIYCADENRHREMRSMCAFGFEAPRITSLPGMNAKLTEVGALTALLQLGKMPAAIRHRQMLSSAYRTHLSGWDWQKLAGKSQVFAFESTLLPASLSLQRPQVLEMLRSVGVGASTYFSPHVAEHPYFMRNSVSGDLCTTNDIAKRIVTLPIFDAMTKCDVEYVCQSILQIATELEQKNGPYLCQQNDDIAAMSARSTSVPFALPDPGAEYIAVARATRAV